MMDQKLIDAFWARKAELESLSAEALLGEVLRHFGVGAVQANSLGAEDVVITHILSKIDPKFSSFTLDTGRLNPETYELMDRLMQKYGLDLEVLFPEAAEVEAMVRAKGINLFYESLENRKLCCEIRKLKSLARVLLRHSTWICGLRREQSATRVAVEKIEIDVAHGGLLKINPLADWTRDQVWDFIKVNGIPYNRLHDQGFVSIGCASCTRAIRSGEPERAGRWWWEDPDTKECGLHPVKK